MQDGKGQVVPVELVTKGAKYAANKLGSAMTHHMTEASNGPRQYLWARDWVEPGVSDLAMSHTSVVITGERLLIVGATSGAALTFNDTEGHPVRVVPVEGVTEVHDLLAVQESGEDLIWLANCGFKIYGGSHDLEFRRAPTGGDVTQIDPQGNRRRTLDRPPLDVYKDSPYQPTAVAVDELRMGGSGDIWVADGYGAGLVHRYGRDGQYLATISGEEGAGHFDEPHDLLVDRRGTSPELYIADRKNGRIQVYDLDGRFKRAVGQGTMPGPTSMALSGDVLVVSDLLAARITLLDPDDALIVHLFAEPSAPKSWDDLPDAWPNARASDGTHERAHLKPGAFHCPHGVAVDEEGTIYVTEFAIGGRVSVLQPRES